MSEESNSDIGDAISAAAEDATRTGEIFDQGDEQEGDGSKKPSSDAVEPNTYNLRPTLEDRFKVQAVKDVIQQVLIDELSGKVYSQQEAKEWTSNIANIISSKVRDMKWKRYKHIVEVLIGEQRGAGVKCGLKCVWDSETDNYACETFTNESMFCLVAVYAIYFY